MQARPDVVLGPVAGRADRTLAGLATLSRMVFEGRDVDALAKRLLARTQADRSDAEALLDLCIYLQITGHREVALALQAEALAMQRLYRVGPERTVPPALRILALMAPGELMANTPIEFLLDGSDAALDLLYLDAATGCPERVPEHDLLFVAVGYSERNRALLEELQDWLRDWPRPVVNAPAEIERLSRHQVAETLDGVPGVVAPAARPIARDRLEALGAVGEADELAFPLIVRPFDSHAGHGLTKLDRIAELPGYLQGQRAQAFYVSPFVDYRGTDGLYRKYRIAFIEGRPYACHMGVSEHWMIHYLNAGMGESADKRAEEAAFMRDFEAVFADRHAVALAGVAGAWGLDYLGIDCAETPSGELLVFEVDTAMAVHAMDPVDTYPYKRPQMRRVLAAFREMLERVVAKRR